MPVQKVLLHRLEIRDQKSEVSKKQIVIVSVLFAYLYQATFCSTVYK